MIIVQIYFNFSTGQKYLQIQNFNDERLKDLDEALNKVLLNLAKRVVADGEGASKFITIDIQSCKMKGRKK